MQQLGINKFSKNMGKWDKIYSTYRHKIFYNDGNSVDGYSKGENVDEPKDKTKLLMNIISRLLNNGYLVTPQRNCFKIEFYKRDFTQLKQNEEIVLTLYPESSQLGNYAPISCDPIFNQFIKQIDKLRIDALNGNTINFAQAKPTKTPQPKHTKDDFDYTPTTREQLLKKCTSLIERGFERGRVEGYWYSMLEKGKVIN